MSTPIGDSTTYATPLDIVNRYDIRDICQWISDTGTPVPQSQIGVSAALLACIADASGMIEAATLVADRYTAADLQALYQAGGNSAAFLIRLTCDLAIGLLMERRPYLERDLPPAYFRALEWLQELRDGKRIFAFQEVADAGNIKVTQESSQDISSRNLATYQASRLFGADRANQFIPGTAPGAGARIVP